ncbi:hypothetical protein IRY61_06470 [Candidatus Saccharibacteria bacterium]|nr:hypothetical protein [Candidatus Saccharibacteria bacterium]
MNRITKWAIVATAALAVIIFAVFVIMPDERHTASRVQKINLDHKTYSNLKELEDDADVIIRGTVFDAGKTLAGAPLRSEDGREVPGIPTTEFQVAVKKIYKGIVTDDQVTVVLTGGTLEGTRYEAEGMPWLVKHSDTIMYLHLGDDGKYYPLAGGAAIALRREGKRNNFILPTEVHGAQEIEIPDSSL